MVIHEMTLEECDGALARMSLARLACEWQGQPYLVPVYLSYDHRDLYGFATPGQKIEWMRANPRVCVEIDDVESANRWVSIVVQGTYEEVPDTPEHEATRAHAHGFLSKRATWWEPASLAAGHPFTPIFYRIRPQRITGRRASPHSAKDPIASPSPARGWLRRLLDRARLPSSSPTLPGRSPSRSIRSTAERRRGLHESPQDLGR